MSVILILAKKELLERFASRRYIALLLLTAFTLLLAFISGTADYQARLRDFTASAREGGRFYALHQPSPLSLLARGVDDELGRRFDVDPGLGLIEVSGASGKANRIFQVLPSMDVQYVIRVILSLVAALLVFDSISGEKRAGRLALLVSHPVSRAQIFAGKWVGSHVALATVLVPTFVLGLLWAALRGVQFGPGEWISVVVFGLFGALYLSFFLTFGLTVSAFTRRPATSSVVVLLAWVLLVFVLPSITAQAVASRNPLPMAQRMDAQNTRAWISGVFDRLEAEREGHTPMQTLDHRVLEETGGVDRDYFARAARRVWVHRNLSPVSPASSFVYGATAIAGTGAEEALRFKGDLLAYRGMVVDAPADTEVPPLVAKVGTARSAWIAILGLPLISLIVSTGLVFVIGLWMFNRYDAR
jgi:ABC-type transport system involved in multi-copper enzyme maturation permease subunit